MVPLVADAAHNFCVRSRPTRVDRLGDLSRTEPPGSRTRSTETSLVLSRLHARAALFFRKRRTVPTDNVGP